MRKNERRRVRELFGRLFGRLFVESLYLPRRSIGGIHICGWRKHLCHIFERTDSGTLDRQRQCVRHKQRGDSRCQGPYLEYYEMKCWMDLRFSLVSGFVVFLFFLQLFRLASFDSFGNGDFYFNRERVTVLERISNELLSSSQKGRFFLDHGYAIREEPDGKMTIGRRVFRLMKSNRIRSCDVGHGHVTWGWYNPCIRRWFEYRYTPHPETGTSDSQKWTPAFGENWQKRVR